uniref:Isoform 3 of Ankyrin repeat and death domain-containing protein 1A n=1 Tax=Homo sapiens TaxID=9606 RepID=Q495B1-6
MQEELAWETDGLWDECASPVCLVRPLTNPLDLDKLRGQDPL